jgi:hypothetical protein
MSGVLSGLAQFFAPSHLLAVVAIGLLAGQGVMRFPVATFGAFAFGLAMGSIMIAAALRGESMIALIGIAAMAGIAIAVALPIPAFARIIAAAAAGATLAFNAPPQAITIPSAVATQVGFAAAALATFGLIASIATRADRPWQRIGLRVVGSWIAASAILVLALRLAR